MRLRAHHPNRIGANPVAVKTTELTGPRKGRLSNSSGTPRFPQPGYGPTDVLPNYSNPGTAPRKRIYL
jgi:hypothetical protein